MSEQNVVESKVREIRRKTRKRYSTEEKIRIVLEGLRGEDSIAALCRIRFKNLALSFMQVLVGIQHIYSGSYKPAILRIF